MPGRPTTLHSNEPVRQRAYEGYTCGYVVAWLSRCPRARASYIPAVAILSTHLPSLPYDFLSSHSLSDRPKDDPSISIVIPQPTGRVTNHMHPHVCDHRTLPHSTAPQFMHHVSFRHLATVPQRVRFYVVYSVPRRLSGYYSSLNSVGGYHW